jgi:hypothetical protein
LLNNDCFSRAENHEKPEARPMTRWWVGVSCVLGAIAARADDPVFSGPQAGEALTPFKAVAFSGPRAGREVELPGEFAGKPTVLVFVHEITRPALQLIRPVDHYAARWADLGLNSRVVWLAADPAQAEQFLERARNSLNLKSPVVIALGGAEGPGNYGLNRNVTLTILVADGGKVAANFAIVQPNETDAPEVLAAVARLVGMPAPTPEEIKAESGPGPMRARREAAPDAEPGRDAGGAGAVARIEALEEQVAALTEALNEARGRIAKLEGSPPPAPIRGRSPARPGKAAIDPELQRLMRQVIGLEADPSQVGKAAEAMARWAGDDPRKKSVLAECSKLVLGLGYGSEAAKAALSRMAGD